MGRDKEFPLSLELESNLKELLLRLNKFRTILGKPMVVRSGYRPGHYNTEAGGSATSAHLTCQACDFSDNSRELMAYILANPSILEQCDLYMENPQKTPTWIHLQSRRVASGARVFNP